MKISFAAISCLALSATSAAAFAPSSPHRISTELNASPEWLQKAQQTLVTAGVAASLWSAPAFLDSTGVFPTTTSTVTAKEMASGSGSRVNKDAESLLRYGLPINNKEVRKLQVVLEDVKYDIQSKRKGAALSGSQKAKAILNSKDTEKMKAACREPDVCQKYLTAMIQEMDPLSAALKESQDTFQGSDQERAALDKAYEAQNEAVASLSLLEEQMVPKGYKVPVPEEYNDLPQLQGRATVSMTLVKPNKAPFQVDAVSYPEAKMKMVIDGYNAPVTGGNFLELVQKGFYDKMPIQRSDGFVVQTGRPEGNAEGYVAPGSKSVGNGKNGERLIPLEIFVKGDKAPIYEVTIEDEGRGGEATVIPFSSYGAMGWAREEYDPNSGSSQFFWLLFDSDLTPAGKNVLDGRYPCFGYVVEGADFLKAVEEGDIIVSAKVTEGAENLILPK
ncbi:hypothetical protein FisN_1Hh129 [Fistulifera solaris]|uniref:peptidylprolyl isomerase n=1 Tax=Fistulifera solaris TaxID=1519565 RepID=A0A1Z5JEL3_FISSO|nr:hypothetical protein FisN_1Hh129 [Fistulifera solaris]|eukprot:GAX12201.1 hypothetical protein FisN_1Hh129 [Fistulifera solaris]